MNFNGIMILFTMFVLQQIGILQSMPSNQYIELEKTDHATHVRPIQLYSKQSQYVAISEDGDVYATRNRSSEDAILEMHSYSVKEKSIRRRGNGRSWWISINKNGQIRTRRKNRDDTRFLEHDDGLWLWYQNKKHKFVLAFRKNLQPKHKINVTSAIKNSKNKSTRFLIMKVPQNLQTFRPDPRNGRKR